MARATQRAQRLALFVTRRNSVHEHSPLLRSVSAYTQVAATPAKKKMYLVKSLSQSDTTPPVATPQANNWATVRVRRSAPQVAELTAKVGRSSRATLHQTRRVTHLFKDESWPVRDGSGLLVAVNYPEAAAPVLVNARSG
jgi:hypothetical protein